MKVLTLWFLLFASLISFFGVVRVMRHVEHSVQTAVCSTDLDCALWEIRNNVPINQRCFGAPCPMKGKN